MRPTTPFENAVFEALCEVARPIILEDFTVDSCIASTRIGLDVLAYFSINAREIPVVAGVLNAEAVDLLSEGTTIEELNLITKEISLEQPGGPWSVGIGAGTGTGWAGHLIIGAEETGAVLDLSIDQGARPHKGLDLKPYWVVIDNPAWWVFATDGSTPGGEPIVTIASEEGAVITLDRRVPDPTGYRSSLNWVRKTSGDSHVYRRATGQIIRDVRAAVDRG